MFRLRSRGSFNRTNKMLKRLASRAYLSKLEAFGEQGVQALASATMKDTGLTSRSWKYKIEKGASFVRIVWYNTEMIDGAPLAVLLQYGHGTNGGGYVEGRDYINPAMRPVFDEISKEAWAELTKC